jgi:hypothetical protein
VWTLPAAVASGFNVLPWCYTLQMVALLIVLAVVGCVAAMLALLRSVVALMGRI